MNVDDILSAINFTENLNYTENVINATTENLNPIENLHTTVAPSPDGEKLSHFSVVVITVFGTIALVGIIGTLHYCLHYWWIERPRRVDSEQERPEDAPPPLPPRAPAQPAEGQPPLPPRVPVRPAAAQLAELILHPPPPRVLGPPAQPPVVRIDPVPRPAFPAFREGRPYLAWGSPEQNPRRVPMPVIRTERPTTTRRRNGGGNDDEATSSV